MVNGTLTGMRNTLAQRAHSPTLFAPTPPRPDRPLFLFLPGMDGTGQLLTPQVPTLEPHFDLRCVQIPVENRQGWPDLAVAVLTQVRPLLGHRPFYLMGESYGACLGLQMALMAPEIINRLVLLNSASALRQQPWYRWAGQAAALFPDWLFHGSGSIALQLLAAFDRISPEVQRMLIEAVQSVPQDCVAWRLSMLQEFNPDPQGFQALTMPTVLLASDRDRLLPSHAEALRLSRLLPNARIGRLPYSGHGALLEQAVSLADLLAQTDSLPQPFPLGAPP